MLKQLLAEVLFRYGRRNHREDLLRRAARLAPSDLRVAGALADLGCPESAGRSVIASLCMLRVFARSHELEGESRQFIAEIARQLELSRSQHFQDIAALMFASSRRDGYFVEVGVGDGEALSNSWMLEKTLGWSGLLVEPDRRFHAAIRASRSARLDTRAAYASDGEVLRFIESTRSGYLSTLAKYRSSDGRMRHGDASEVQTVTLRTLLRETNAPKVIDFLSIDTEGSELDVLEGMDFSQYDVRFMSIEHNHVPMKRQRIAEAMAIHGFREVLAEFSGVDIWLARSPQPSAH